MGANDRYRDARARAGTARGGAREASVSSRLLIRRTRRGGGGEKTGGDRRQGGARASAREGEVRVGSGTGSSSGRPEWNPLMGGSESRGYRPSPRAPRRRVSAVKSRAEKKIFRSRRRASRVRPRARVRSRWFQAGSDVTSTSERFVLRVCSSTDSVSDFSLSRRRDGTTCKK